MPPVSSKKSLKLFHGEKKVEKKKWKEHKLLKAAGLQKVPENVVKTQDEKEISTPIQDGKISETPSASFRPTVSIAVPGSILDNAQSPELRTYLAGQVARAACIYCVDEIVVFDDKSLQKKGNSGVGLHIPGESSCSQMARLLQYLECPQYIRKHLFPIHKDLQYVGVLNPLDAPHHLRKNDEFPFREGIVTNHLLKQGKGSYVDVGLMGRFVRVDKPLVPGVRVTVHLQPVKEGSKKIYGKVVSPSLPRQMLGVYWGYMVRVAESLSDVFAKTTYKGGYDLTIGTSDKGRPLNSCSPSSFQGFKHILIVFGGLEGLEAALESDESLDINDVSLLFDKYLNTCPNQGTRTIRTEEAILISLAELIPKFVSCEVAMSAE